MERRKNNFFFNNIWPQFFRSNFQLLAEPQPGQGMVNPPMPRSDWYQLRPYNIIAESNKKVMRIKEVIVN